jgi:hypothetical protein
VHNLTAAGAVPGSAAAPAAPPGKFFVLAQNIRDAIKDMIDFPRMHS